MDKPIPEGVRAIRDVLFRVYMDHDDFEVTTALLHDMAVAVSSLTAAQQPEARGVVDALQRAAESVHVPPKMTETRGEYFKAGARAMLTAMNRELAALTETRNG